MLETLRIQHFALIDSLELELTPGFNVLTGETGAGKSIVLGALNLVLGARSSGDLVRAGAAKAHVEALFRVRDLSPRLGQILSEHDIQLEGDELLLSRSVTPDGRSKAYVCGALTPVSVLAAIGDELVDLHGQHEHQSLLHPERQLDLLDGAGSLDRLRKPVFDAVTRMRAIERQLAEVEQHDRDRARQIEFLRFELNEIETARLERGEEESLRERRSRIANAARIVEGAGKAYASLYDNDGAAASDLAGAAARELQQLADVDAGLRALSVQAQGLLADLDALASEVLSLTGGVEYDPEELEEINQRLTMLSTLKRKYGETIDAILKYADEARTKIGAYEQRDERIAQLRTELTESRLQAQAAAETLSAKRKAVAKRLEKQITATLQELGMKGAQFEARLESAPLGLAGLERAEFHLAANPGEKAKPLRTVASGGEVSRIMLALKAVFAEADQIPTLVFDEIDAGVGGVVANRVAEKLKALSAARQTICITHLPQIAVAADAHFHVSKSAAKGRTTTTVVRLADRPRVEELARLLDGSVSEVSVAHAQALLQAGGR